MARYVRTSSAPIERDYRKYRPQVRKDFRTECAYCFIPELFAGGAEAMELDHFRPRRRFPELTAVYGNLNYSCGPCNRAKSDQWPTDEQRSKGVSFVDCCQDDSALHYRLDESGSLIPRTIEAEYTIDACRLNREHLRRIRAVVAATGEFAL